MIKFTQTRHDWNSLDLAKRMLKAGKEGYQSLFHDIDFDDYILLSTATSEELKKFSGEELISIFEELETLGEKESKKFKVRNGEIVELYWEIDRFSW